MRVHGVSRLFWIPICLLLVALLGLSASPHFLAEEESHDLAPVITTLPDTSSVRVSAGEGSDGVLDGVSVDDASVAKASAAFTVQFGETTIREPIMSVFVLPGETTDLRVETDPPADAVDIEAPDGVLRPAGDRRWTHRAPETPGVSDLTIRHPEGTSILRVFVLTPWDHRGTSLEGYRIGRYRKTARRGRPNYARPTGFVKVTDATRTMQLSPHFRLSQFLCKQTDALPQFALVDTRLLQTLEQILTGVHERGHAAPTLHVMSGFRTPAYNRAIGNTTTYSRHLYGDAADIFVDADGNGYMDDLTGDGRSTKADARYLADVVKAAAGDTGKGFVGGLGIYGPAPHRGPFVHVDLRGYRARW